MHLRTRALPIAAAIVVMALGAAIVTSALRESPSSGLRAAEIDTTRTVSVSGIGRVALTPDTVYMTLGVDVIDPDLGVAQSQAATRMDDVIAALLDRGVAQADIQTATYAINVNRDYNQPGQPIIGYIVTHTVTVKVRDVDNAGNVIAGAVDAGANNVSGVWFGVEDQAGALAQARELAVADARAKAEDLARLVGSSLGPVLSISESSSGGAPAPYDGVAGADKATTVTINPGQTEVTLSVSVVYALN